MKRITITGKVVNAANYVAFLVMGSNKAVKVREIVLQRRKCFNKYPAARVHPASGNLLWLLDQDAASLL
jgi:6-phosphogluconolactonase